MSRWYSVVSTVVLVLVLVAAVVLVAGCKTIHDYWARQACVKDMVLAQQDINAIVGKRSRYPTQAELTKIAAKYHGSYKGSAWGKLTDVTWQVAVDPDWGDIAPDNNWDARETEIRGPVCADGKNMHAVLLLNGVGTWSQFETGPYYDVGGWRTVTVSYLPPRGKYLIWAKSDRIPAGMYPEKVLSVTTIVEAKRCERWESPGIYEVPIDCSGPDAKEYNSTCKLIWVYKDWWWKPLDE